MRSLSDEIKEKKKKDSVSLIYLGQTGYAVVGGGVCVIIDPYLTDSVDRICSDERAVWRRNYDPPIKPENVDFADLVLLSHDHLDHTDPETIVGIHRASPRAKFAASAAFVHSLENYNIPSELILPLESDVSEHFVHNGRSITVTPVPAAHEELHPCAPGGYEELGFVIEICQKKVYHGGDTCVYDGLAERIAGADAAILPSNGRGPERAAIGVVGNMNAREAAGLAAASGIGLALPSHWDLYDNNGETRDNIIAAFGEYPEKRYMLLSPGDAVDL